MTTTEENYEACVRAKTAELEELYNGTYTTTQIPARIEKLHLEMLHMDIVRARHQCDILNPKILVSTPDIKAWLMENAPSGRLRFYTDAKHYVEGTIWCDRLISDLENDDMFHITILDGNIPNPYVGTLPTVTLDEGYNDVDLEIDMIGFIAEAREVGGK